MLRRDVLDLPLLEQTLELAEAFEAYAVALIRRMTPRTGLVEQVREAIAEGLVYLLGYAEPSNSHRAFRRWTGLTPAAWRARSGAQSIGIAT